MERSFVIVQISDLHLDGSGKYGTRVQALHSAIKYRMQGFQHVQERILLITGDIVDAPTRKAFEEAKSVLAQFGDGTFTDIKAIAGNHDVKALGLFAKRDDAYTILGLPSSAESVYYADSGLDLILLDSNAASFAKGKVNQAAYDAMVRDAAALAGDIKARISRREKEREFLDPTEAIVRVLALHHHPLPQATGEGQRVFGVPDEPLMYLVSPATFLEAALSLDVALILHGHRHVQGLTHYAVPNALATTSKSDEFWRTIYVLSCPSSTGHGGDDPGFNIVQLSHTFSGRRSQHEFIVTRYVRRRNAGAFELLDGNLPEGSIHLRIGKDQYRDPALQVSIELRAVRDVRRTQFIQFARRLLTRRAFYDEAEQSWAHALYTYLLTYTVWEDLLTKFSEFGLKADIEPAQRIRVLLNQLVIDSASVLGIDGPELDDLRSKKLGDQSRVMEDLPRIPRRGVNVAEAQALRLRVIQRVNKEMQALGVDLGLGGAVPDQALN